VAGEAAFHKRRVARFAVCEVTEPPAAGCSVLKGSLRHQGNRVPTELLFDMAAAGHAVFDFGTEGTLELRFNGL